MRIKDLIVRCIFLAFPCLHCFREWSRSQVSYWNGLRVGFVFEDLLVDKVRGHYGMTCRDICWGGLLEGMSEVWNLIGNWPVVTLFLLRLYECRVFKGPVVLLLCSLSLLAEAVFHGLSGIGLRHLLNQIWFRSVVRRTCRDLVIIPLCWATCSRLLLIEKLERKRRTCCFTFCPLVKPFLRLVPVDWVVWVGISSHRGLERSSMGS